MVEKKIGKPETAKAIVKPETVKAIVKPEAVKAIVKPEAVKTEVKSVEVKKELVKKAPAKKAPAKKASAAKAVAIKETMYLEFSDKSYTQEDFVKMAKDVWKYDLKKKAADFKEIELYVKPEESTVYYVINKTETGSFSI